MSSRRIVINTSGIRGLKGDKGDPGSPGGGGAGPGVAAGGTTGQLLKKASGTDYDTAWVANPVPAGGTTGQTLVKTSGADYATGWGSPAGTGVPVGGTVGMALLKQSSTDGDATWQDVGTAVHALTGKTTPAGADEFGISDSAASNVWKKFTFTNLVAWLKTQISVNQLASTSGDLNMNTHKVTGVVDPTTAQEAATKNYVDTATGGFLAASAAAIAALLPGLTLTVAYDATLGWVLPAGLSTNANIAWAFQGGDVTHAPPATTGHAFWVKP